MPLCWRWRIIIILLITCLHFCVRTFYAYKSLTDNSATTALTLREMANEEEFMQRLQQIIREEVRSLQVKEHIKSEKVISRLADEYKAKLVQQQKQLPEVEKKDSAFSFRVHMNFSRIFGFF